LINRLSTRSLGLVHASLEESPITNEMKEDGREGIK
jgi:hypothetical protein